MDVLSWNCNINRLIYLKIYGYSQVDFRWTLNGCRRGEQITPLLENKALNRKSKTITVVIKFLWCYTFIALTNVQFFAIFVELSVD